MLALGLLSLAFSTPAGTPPLLGLKLSDDGTFTISLNGKFWLKGGEVRVGSFCSSCSGSDALTPDGKPVVTTGQDALGPFEATTYTWLAGLGDPIMKTTFRSYAAANGTIVFSQSFPKEVPIDTVGAPMPTLGAPIVDGSGVATKSSEGAATLCAMHRLEVLVEARAPPHVGAPILTCLSSALVFQCICGGEVCQDVVSQILGDKPSICEATS